MLSKKCLLLLKRKTVMNDKVKINRTRHIFKAITWNLLAMTITFFVLSYLPPFFGFEALDKSSVGWLVILDRIVKLIFYYFHERAWFASNLGVIKPKNGKEIEEEQPYKKDRLSESFEQMITTVLIILFFIYLSL